MGKTSPHAQITQKSQCRYHIYRYVAGTKREGGRGGRGKREGKKRLQVLLGEHCTHQTYSLKFRVPDSIKGTARKREGGKKKHRGEQKRPPVPSPLSTIFQLNLSFKGEKRGGRREEKKKKKLKPMSVHFSIFPAAAFQKELILVKLSPQGIKLSIVYWTRTPEKKKKKKRRKKKKKLQRLGSRLRQRAQLTILTSQRTTG